MMINTAQAGLIAEATPIAVVLERGAVFFVGVLGAVALIAFILSGIAYLLSAGNEQRQATAKRSTFYAIVGTAVALGAILILRTIGALFGV